MQRIRKESQHIQRSHGNRYSMEVKILKFTTTLVYAKSDHPQDLW